MKKISWKQIITVLATLLTITVNGLANVLPINGLQTGEISDRFKIFFVPAGYVFSIWGLIYLGLILYSVYQALPSQKDNPVLNAIAPLYWVSSLANIAWIFLWHYQIFAATVPAMLVILATLLLIYRDLKGSAAAQKWLVRLPFSIYLGWISVATIANISQFLFFINWSGFGISGEIWAVGMLAVATLLGVLMAWRENDIFYGLVLIWAYIGIAQSQAGAALVVAGSWAGTGMLGLAVLGGILKGKKLY